MKPGIFSSQFILSALAVLASAVIAIINNVPSELAKLPQPWGSFAGGIASLIIPAVIGYISKHYVQGRNDVKKAAMAAGITASATREEAAATINQVLGKGK